MIMISVQDEVGVQSEQSLHDEWISQSFAFIEVQSVSYNNQQTKQLSKQQTPPSRRPVVVRSWCHILNFLRQSLICSPSIHAIGHLSTTGWCLCSQDNEHKKWHQSKAQSDMTSDRLNLQQTCDKLATCNLQLVYRRLLVLLLKSLLATRLSAASRTLFSPSPLRLLSAASTSSLISRGGTTTSDDDPPTK
jgi:hypothetical protein